jgi:nucleoside-diphosphate-sugar epimerase
MKKEKILVTGGAGYIGSILVPKLLGEDYKVTVLDSLIYDQAPLLDYCENPNFEFIRGDVCNAKLVNSLLGLGKKINFAPRRPRCGRSRITGRPRWKLKKRG